MIDVVLMLALVVTASALVAASISWVVVRVADALGLTWSASREAKKHADDRTLALRPRYRR